MRSLATLSKRVAALEEQLRIKPVPLRAVQVMNLLGDAQPAIKAAVNQLVDFLMRLHERGSCPSGCRCSGFCAVRSSSLAVVVYCGPAQTICAESALGIFETSVTVPDGKPVAHGAII